MIEDDTLLLRYAEEGSDAAFAELVQRHLPLVYACALRRVGGDCQLAEDVTQQVFTEVARRALVLARRPVLAGWLFTSARFAAAKAVRTRQRRLQREQEAYIMQELQHDPDPEINWDQARPVLDDMIGELNDGDREAILLRFFEGRDFPTIGARLKLTDNAARMRVERALKKLQAKLKHRGVTSTATIIATVLTEQTAVAVPTGLAANVTGAALAAGSIAASAAVVGGSSGALLFMGVSKLQIGLASALVLATGSGLLIQADHIRESRAEIALLQQQDRELASAEAENRRLWNAAAEVTTLRSDEATLAQLRDEADALRLAQANAAKVAAARANRPHPQISVKTTEALQSLPALQRAKDYPGIMHVVDTILSQVDPSSYDAAYALDLKAKVYLQMDQLTQAIEPWEKALKLSEQYGYFDAKTSQ